MMEAWTQDLRFALRKLLKNPGSTILVVLILGLGIGANTAIFSMVYGILFRALPYENGESLAMIRQKMPAAGVESSPFSVPEYHDYQNQSHSFQGVAEYHSMWFTLLGGEEPRRVQTGVVSSNFFDVLGVDPVLGRAFQEGDEDPSADPVLILSHGYWRREFGGDPSVIGRRFTMNDRIHTVVGILPPVPQYPDENDLYMPTSACPFRSQLESTTDRASDRLVQVFGRLAHGVSFEKANAEVETIAGRIASEHEEAYDDGGGYTADVVPLRELLIGNSRTLLLLLLATVALVLLITCINLTNLTFARWIRREQEIAVRTAMGAVRRRLIQQLLTESIVLTLLGGAVGLVFAYAGLDLLVAFAARFSSRAGEITIDTLTLAFTFGVSILSGLAFGILPALHTSGAAVSTLREGSGRGTMSPAVKRLRNGLIVVELAVSFVLLVGAGLMIRSFWKLQGVDAGFESDRTLAVQMSLNWSKYNNWERRGEFYRSLLEKIEGFPGVEAASAALRMPLDETTAFIDRSFEIEGKIMGEGSPQPHVNVDIVTSKYFETVGIPLLSGRLFDDRDQRNTDRVVILSQTVARRYWDDQNPVGTRITTDGGKVWRTVVGVVGDAKLTSLQEDDTEVVYYSFNQIPYAQATVFVKSTGNPLQLTRPVREAVYGIDPEQPVGRIQTLEEMRRKSIASPRLTMILLVLFAGLALVIAAAGLGGVMAFSVSQQTREIGVRMALGAERRVVLWQVLKGAVALVTWGLGVGVAVAFFAARWVENLVFGVSPTDLVTFLGVTLLLVMVTAVASFVPARRATLVDPVTALRCE